MFVALCLPAVLHGLPFSYYGDELHFVKRAMAIGAGDPNPHWFHKPAFLMYLLAGVYGAYFVAGFLLGTFSSVAEFGAHFLNDMGPFLLLGRLAVLAFGAGTLALTYDVAARLSASRAAGLLAVAMAVVLYPVLATSVVVKADMPCAFFVAASFAVYLRSVERNGWRHLLAAAALAGVAMGTKYYGIVMLPVIAVGELAARQRFDRGFTASCARIGVAALTFLLAFFVVSPYNFLDPTWGQETFGRLLKVTGIEAATPEYEIDRGIEFTSGPGNVIGALTHLLAVLAKPTALSLPLCLAAMLGWVELWLRRAYRNLALVSTWLIGFALLAAALAPYHVDYRHLAAVYPALLALAAGGIRGLVTRLPRSTRPAAAIALAAMSVSTTAGQSWQHLRTSLLPDSRNLAYAWITTHIPSGSAVLLDDYQSPLLPISPAAARRLLARLDELPADEAFTASQRQRLELVETYPAAVSYDVHLLGHQWWLPAEVSAEELIRSAKNRDMSNPLVSRNPAPLGTYADRGICYVVTNSAAMQVYRNGSKKADAFPSFAAFYRELRALRPLIEFGGPGTTGPRVYVYRLSRGDSVEGSAGTKIP